MLKFSLTLFFCVSLLLMFKYVANTGNNGSGPAKHNAAVSKQAQSLNHSKRDSLHWPPGFTITRFAGPDLTPSPACLAVAATGEGFVGVDMIGSLGKDPGKGRIIIVIDSDNDGKLAKHTDFADVDDPRGILILGDQVF
ncbi:MAG: heme-binding protein, partial [Mucilaginibacter sp.]|nr:heme-binding protein [Mucilaginibacter sp.]